MSDTLPGEEGRPTCIDASKMYWEMIAENIELFPAEFVQHEMTEQRTLGDVDAGVTASHIWLVMMSTHAEINEAVVRCDLPQRYVRDAAFRDLMDNMLRHSSDGDLQPCIYANYLCHTETGEMMTPNEIQRIVSGAKRYVHDGEFALQIDGIVGTALPRVCFASFIKPRTPC